MGIQQADFEEAFLKALSSQAVMKSLRQSICGNLQEEIRTLNANINHMHDLLREKDERIVQLENKISTMEDVLDDHEQYSRRNSVRLSGLATVPREDAMETTLEFINEAMQLSPPLEPTEIDRVHRVGSSTVPNRPMLIKFATYRSRRRVMEVKSQLKNKALTQKWSSPSSTGIYLSEDLTKKRANLLYQARQMRRAGRINGCWSIDGKIMIKDLRGNNEQVKSLQELEVHSRVTRVTRDRSPVASSADSPPTLSLSPTRADTLQKQPADLP